MSERDPDHLVVGHLQKAHGVKGEFYVSPLTDHPGTTFAAGTVFRVGDSTGNRPSDYFPSLEIEGVRPFKKGFLVKFVGIEDRTEAERFRGRYLLRPIEEMEELEEGEIFYHQLLGMEVETADGARVGSVQEVYELEPAHLLEIRGERGLFHVPLAGHVVKEVDVKGRRLVLDPPEGLLDQ